MIIFLYIPLLEVLVNELDYQENPSVLLFLSQDLYIGLLAYKHLFQFQSEQSFLVLHPEMRGILFRGHQHSAVRQN